MVEIGIGIGIWLCIKFNLHECLRRLLIGFPGDHTGCVYRGYGFLSQQNPAPNLGCGNSALAPIGYPEVRIPKPVGDIRNRRSVLHISP